MPTDPRAALLDRETLRLTSWLRQTGHTIDGRSDGMMEEVVRTALHAVLPDSDAPTPREALEPFRSAAESEASRPWVEDGYFTGPGGLTVGDWRRLRAALASPVERHVDLATIRSALADAIGKTDTLDDLAAFLVDRLQAAASTAAAGEGAAGGDADAAWAELMRDIWRRFVGTLRPSGTLGRSSTRRSAVGLHEAFATLRQVLDETDWSFIEAALRSSRATSETPRETPLAGPLDVERLARALHGTGAEDFVGEPWTWGSCVNWEPGWGPECGPDKHADEAANLARRYAAAARGSE